MRKAAARPGRAAGPTLPETVQLTVREVDLLTGRLDAAKLRTLLPLLIDIGAVDHWWLCGPFGMVTAATEVLGEFGVEPAPRLQELAASIGMEQARFPPNAARPATIAAPPARIRRVVLAALGVGADEAREPRGRA